MIVQGLEFQARYGKANELVALLKKGQEVMGKYGYPQGRILTDLTRRMFTIVWESEFSGLAALEELRAKIFAAPEFGSRFNLHSVENRRPP